MPVRWHITLRKQVTGLSVLDNVELNLIRDLDDVFRFREWLGRHRAINAIGVDTETTGLNVFNDKVRLIQFGDDVAGWAMDRDDWLGLARWVFDNFEGDFLLHNASYDAAILESSCGIKVPRHRTHDTLIRSALLEPHMSKALKNQAGRHVDPAAAGLQEVLKGTNFTWATVPVGYGPYWCVPKTTEILTRTGWKSWNKIDDGDETLGYENGELRWTPITGVHTPGVAPVVRFGNSYWSTLCTANHRWVIEHKGSTEVIELDRGWHRPGYPRRLIRSAPAEGGKCELTPNEAAVLAWLMSDGWFERDRPSAGGYVAQSTKKYAAEVQQLLETEGALKHITVYDETNRKFRVYGEYIKRIWNIADLDNKSLMQFVTELTPEARAAWNQAWIMAEGHVKRPDLSQNRGEQLDAIMLSMYMDGYAIHGGNFSKKTDKCVRFRYTKRDMTPQKSTYAPAGLADVWCPTTGNSTWTARDENGNIFVTGNTYGALDPVLTYHLELHHRPLVEAECPRAYELEMAVLWVVSKMSRNGAYVDRPFARRYLQKFEDYCLEVERWCQAEYGLKAGSNAAVVAVLQEAGYEFSKSTAAGAVALDREVLEGIDHPLAQAVLNRRRAQKMASTYLLHYVNEADADSLIHPTFNTVGARTGRMSCSEPNLQNLPRLGTTQFGDVVRSCIKTRYSEAWDPDTPALTNLHRHGGLLMCDFDQIEMRILAHMAQETTMIDAFNGPDDFFVTLARQIFQDPTITKKDKRRQITKNAGYAKIYFAGVAKFAKTAGIPVGPAREFLQRMDALYPNVPRFSQQVLETAQRRRADEGLAYVRSPLTNRIHIGDPRKEYALINYLIQGAAAEVNKMKLIELDAAGLGDWMFATVHDEVLLDTPGEHVREATHVLDKVMNDDTLLSVPITAGLAFGERWGKKYDYEEVV